VSDKKYTLIPASINWVTASNLEKLDAVSNRVMGMRLGSAYVFNPFTDARDRDLVIDKLKGYDFSITRDDGGWFCYMREKQKHARPKRPDKEATVCDQPTQADAIMICALRVSGVEVVV